MSQDLAGVTRGPSSEHRLLDHTADLGTESHDSLQVLRVIGTQQLTT